MIAKGRKTSDDLFDIKTYKSIMNKVLNYNAKYDKKNPGEIITNDKSLRAFRFNRFQTFWNNASELQSEMYELINDGVKFEEILAELERREGISGIVEKENRTKREIL